MCDECGHFVRLFHRKLMEVALKATEIECEVCTRIKEVGDGVSQEVDG